MNCVSHSSTAKVKAVTVNRPNGPSREISLAIFTHESIDNIVMCSADTARAIAAKLQEAADLLQSGKDLKTLDVHTGELS